MFSRHFPPLPTSPLPTPPIRVALHVYPSHPFPPPRLRLPLVSPIPTPPNPSHPYPNPTPTSPDPPDTEPAEWGCRGSNLGTDRGPDREKPLTYVRKGIRMGLVRLRSCGRSVGREGIGRPEVTREEQGLLPVWETLDFMRLTQ